MTELDKALETFQQDMENPQHQSMYYDLFLNSVFYIPTYDEEGEKVQKELQEDGSVMPLVLEAEGDNYMMLFDTEEKMHNWAEEEVAFVALPGYLVAEITTPELFWALNVGTEYQKQFVPDEIKWLQDVVKQCNAAAENQEDEPSSSSMTT
jgi:hypothetical protein